MGNKAIVFSRQHDGAVSKQLAALSAYAGTSLLEVERRLVEDPAGAADGTERGGAASAADHRRPRPSGADAPSERKSKREIPSCDPNSHL